MTEAAMEGSILRVVGIAGSLRRRSFNRSLLLAARDLAPTDLVIDIHEVGEVPLFNEDLEAGGRAAPAAVEQLRRAVRNADGLLLATPEYNHGVPGVLKNAIDWLSQPLRHSALEGKPTAVMGASTGLAGTARSQTQLRQSFVLTNSPVMPQPEVLVGRAHEKFDAAGQLTDEPTRQFLTTYLVQMCDWLRRQKAADRPLIRA